MSEWSLPEERSSKRERVTKLSGDGWIYKTNLRDVPYIFDDYDVDQIQPKSG